MEKAASKLWKWLGRLSPLHPETREIRYLVQNLTRNTTIGDRVEVADRGARRRKGLLGRTGLESGEGLWIVPCEAVHTFFMQFDLDLVYLDRRHRVVKTICGVRPGRLSACLTAHSILELPVGTIRASLTQRGDLLSVDEALPYEPPAALVASSR